MLYMISKVRNSRGKKCNLLKACRIYKHEGRTSYVCYQLNFELLKCMIGYFMNSIICDRVVVERG